MKIVAVDRPNADRWNAARSRQKIKGEVLYQLVVSRLFCSMELGPIHMQAFLNFQNNKAEDWAMTEE